MLHNNLNFESLNFHTFVYIRIDLIVVLIAFSLDQVHPPTPGASN